MKTLIDEENKKYPYCLCDDFIIITIVGYTVSVGFTGDENCVYTIHPEPDKARLELIWNSQ